MCFTASIPQDFCSVVQCVAVCYSVLQCVAVCRSVVQCAAVCCSVLQCVASYVFYCALLPVKGVGVLAVGV